MVAKFIHFMLFVKNKFFREMFTLVVKNISWGCYGSEIMVVMLTGIINNYLISRHIVLVIPRCCGNKVRIVPCP
jgi:hypothetical protein